MDLRMSPDGRTVAVYDPTGHRYSGPCPWHVIAAPSEGPSWRVGARLSEGHLEGWTALVPQPDQQERVVALQALVADLKAELKRFHKLYGRQSETISRLRGELANARLFRTCWKKRQESDCPGCRTVYRDDWPPLPSALRGDGSILPVCRVSRAKDAP